MKGMQLELFGHQESKSCSKCGEVKPLDYFSKNRSKRDGHQTECKVCNKAYCQDNKEAMADYNKAYRKANKEAIADYRKAYRKANKEANREANREYFKEYYQTNREYYNEANVKRVALKKSNTPEFILDCEVEKKRRVDTYKLRSLMTKVTGIQHHVDHMWPLSDGGPHWSGNLQVIPATDNLSKKASVDLEIKITIQEGLEYARQCYERR